MINPVFDFFGGGGGGGADSLELVEPPVEVLFNRTNTDRWLLNNGVKRCRFTMNKPPRFNLTNDIFVQIIKI
jgi:hypothetical protein